MASPAWQRTATGIVVTPASGAKAVRLELYGDRIVRVTESPDGNLDVKPTPSVTAQPLTQPFTATQSAGAVTLNARGVTARVSLADGRVSFAALTARQTLPKRDRAVSRR